VKDSDAQSIVDRATNQACARVGDDGKLIEIELNRMMREDEKVFAAFRHLGLLMLEGNQSVKH
jgi:hypothetical protein